MHTAAADIPKSAPERLAKPTRLKATARDRTRSPLHASTQNSSLPPQSLPAAAFEPGRTFSTTSACTQQQQTRQNQRWNASLSQTRLKRSRTASHPSASHPHAHPHALLFAAASGTAAGSLSAGPSALHIAYTHTAAEKQHRSVSVDTEREKGV